MAEIGKAIMWLVIGAAAAAYLIRLALLTPTPVDELGSAGTVLWSIYGFIRNIFLPTPKGGPGKGMIMVPYGGVARLPIKR